MSRTLYAGAAGTPPQRRARVSETPNSPRRGAARTKALAALLAAAGATLFVLHAGPSIAITGALPAAPASALDCGNATAEHHARLRAEAAAAFREHRYATAYGRFAELADAGDTAAARVALLMLREGPVLFGSDWSATLGQQARWNALVVNGGRQPLPALEPNGGE